MTNPDSKNLYVLRTLCRATGVSRSTIWRWVKSGEFPAPIQLGPRAVAWPASEIEGWMAARPTDYRDTPSRIKKSPGQSEAGGFCDSADLGRKLNV